MNSSAEFQLLFGLLALQNNLISRQQLVSAFSEWIVDKQRRLGDLLQSQGSLDAATAQLIHSLAERHVDRHGGAVAESLAQLPLPAECREQLATLSDQDLQASLVQHASRRPDSKQPDSRSTGSKQVESIHVTATIAHDSSDSVRFRFLRPHAEGGLGRVSVAFDQELHREVALKEIKERFADDLDSRSRFLREAEITGALEHPGIVPVYGLGRFRDGRPFYAMRMIRGTSLKVAIDKFYEKRLSQDFPDEQVEFRRLLQRLVVVCDTLEFAHSRKVLHRDIKPGNIMLGRYGETLIVDWGLAKSMSAPAKEPADSPAATTPMGTIGPSRDDEKLSAHDTADRGDSTWHPRGSSGSEPTQMGRAIGTPAFMSPEQAAGRVDQLSPASDIYSVGATLYYLLTGRVPFGDADLGSVLQKVQQGDFPKPRAVRNDLPLPLEAICLKAMSANPSDRYESTSQMGRDLERFLADEPVEVHRENWRGRASRWTRRHRSWVWAGVLSLSCLCLALACMVIVTVQERAVTKEHLRESLVQTAASLSGVQPSRPVGWRDRTLRKVQDAVAIRPGADLRNVALTAFIGEDRKLLREFKLSSEARSVAISAQDDLCSFLGGEGLQIYQLSSGKQLRAVSGFESPPLCQVFLGKSSLLACGLQSGAMQVVDTKGGQVVYTLRPAIDELSQTQPCLAIAYGPEPGLLTTFDGEQVRVWNLKEQKLVVEVAYYPSVAPAFEAAPAAAPPIEAPPASGAAPAATHDEDQAIAPVSQGGKPRTRFGSDSNKKVDTIKEIEKQKRLTPPPAPPGAIAIFTQPFQDNEANAPIDRHVALAVSLEQKRIAVACESNTIQVWHYAGGAFQHLTGATSWVQFRVRLEFVGQDYLFVASDNDSESGTSLPGVAPAAEAEPAGGAAAPCAGAAQGGATQFRFVSQPDPGPSEPRDPGPSQPPDSPTQPLDPTHMTSGEPTFSDFAEIDRLLSQIDGPAEVLGGQLRSSAPTDLGQLLFDPVTVHCNVVELSTGKVSPQLQLPIGELQQIFRFGDQLGIVSQQGLIAGLEVRSSQLSTRWFWVLSRGDISAACALPDNQQLLVAHEGRKAELLERQAGNCKHILASHQEGPRSFLDWNEQNVLVSVPWNLSAEISNLDGTGNIDWLAIETHRVDGVEWQAGGERLFLLSDTGLIRAFSPEELRPMEERAPATGQSFQLPLGQACKAWSLVTGPSNRLAVLSNDGQVALVRWGEAPEVEHNLFREHAIIRSMSFAPDGQSIATGDDAGKVAIWSITSGKSVKEISLGVPVNAVHYAQDGRSILVLTNDAQLLQCDALSGTRHWSTSLPNQAGQIAVNDHLIACGCLDGRLVLCDRTSGELLAHLQGHNREVKRLKWRSDGSLMTASSYGEVVRWDVPGLRKELATLRLDWPD